LGAHVVAGALAKRNRCAFVVPTISLIGQTFDKFVKNGISPGDIGVMQADHPHRRPNAALQICSAQTLASRGVPDVTFAVIDEAHIGFEVIDKWMDESPNKIFVALTATPWRKRMGDRWDDLLQPATLPDLTDLGLLTPIVGYSVGVPDVSDIPMVGDDYHLGKASARMSEKAIVGDIVATWIKRGEGEPTLVFAVDRAHARVIEEEFAKSGITFAYIDAFTPAEEREAAFKQLRQRTIAGIVSIGTMIVGIDEDIRCIIWARLTRSDMLFVQALGRGMRPAEGKARMILLDHAGTVQGTDRSIGLPEEIEARHTCLHTSKQEAAEKAAGREREANPARPVECSECSVLIPLRAKACPGCGFVPRRVCTVDTRAGELQEIGRDRGAAPKKGKREPVKAKLAAMGMQEIYSQLLAMQGTKKDGWVRHKFEAIFDTAPPWNLKVHPVAPSSALQSWIRSEQIRWARSRAREPGDDRGEAGGYANAAE
jgi:superfamily II DNA or RNA helicase